MAKKYQKTSTKRQALTPTENRLSRRLGIAAVLCLALVGSLYALSRTRANTVVEEPRSCETGNHTAHTSNLDAEGDALGVVEAPVIDAVNTPAPAPQGMVWIPGGEFSMGSEAPDMRDARPFHRVRVDGFWMDQTEVTNEEFASFVKATGYVTIRRRKLLVRASTPSSMNSNQTAGWAKEVWEPSLSMVTKPPKAASKRPSREFSRLTILPMSELTTEHR